MSETLSSGLDKHIDRLLRELGSRGILDVELSKDDLDQLLAAAPLVSLSDDFDQRARAAMAEAQSAREKRDPAVALGTVVAQARSQTGLGLAEVASRTGVSVKLLEALEVGQLSARQILRNFPPAVVAQLLAAIGLAVHEFSSRLMDLVATDRKTPDAVAAQLVHRQQQPDSTTLVMDIVEYVASLERIAQSK